LGWVPQFLSEDQAQFIEFICRYHPSQNRDARGLDLKTDIFLDLVYAKTYGPEAQEKSKIRYRSFNADCKIKFGKVFAELSTEEKSACLKDHEATTAKFNRGVWGTGRWRAKSQ